MTWLNEDVFGSLEYWCLIDCGHKDKESSERLLGLIRWNVNSVLFRFRVSLCWRPKWPVSLLTCYHLLSLCWYWEGKWVVSSQPNEWHSLRDTISTYHALSSCVRMKYVETITNRISKNPTVFIYTKEYGHILMTKIFVSHLNLIEVNIYYYVL